MRHELRWISALAVAIPVAFGVVFLLDHPKALLTFVVSALVAGAVTTLILNQR